MCDEHYYQFESDSDMRRHFDLCHSGNPTMSYSKDYFRCDGVRNGQSCGFKCDTRDDLNGHIASLHPRKNSTLQNNYGGAKKNVVQENKKLSRKAEDELACDEAIKKLRLDAGTRVTVWYHDKRRYYDGEIATVLKDDKYEMRWDDGRKKKGEVVRLKPKHNTLNEKDKSRWNLF
jgi:hypothetical protein